MLKHLLTTLTLASCLSIVELSINHIPVQAASSVLSYSFYGEQLPLKQKSETLAVSFIEASSHKSTSSYAEQLRHDLATYGAKVQVLGKRYALIETKPDKIQSLTTRLQQLSYVDDTFPVLQPVTKLIHPDIQAKTTDTSQLILPPEILITFEPNLSQAQKQLLLQRHQLKVIRPLRFTQHRYLVSSQKARGLEVLTIANRLSQVNGIRSAAPNFIQKTVSLPQTGDANPALLSLTDQLNKLKSPKSPIKTNLLPLAWHLNSTPYRGQRMPRTDIHATDAWDTGYRGDDVVVAVLDSLIQWDHPDLAHAAYDTSQTSEPLPEETYGWDFAEDDPDTRISTDELKQLVPKFQDTFQLSWQKMLANYPEITAWLKQFYPEASSLEIAQKARTLLQGNISAEFHGTWSAGVIAAQPHNVNGTIGVAPNAKILPVRVFGLGSYTSSAILIEATGYAAERGADIINMSLGGPFPDEAMVQHMLELLDAHPNLVVVASAGNSNIDGVAFPAAIPGVLSVGATDMEGYRSFYSQYGGQLDVVAPGGDLSLMANGGILTTGGTYLPAFWEGLKRPNKLWGYSLDPLGQYVQVQGTSFAAPNVSGVLALMMDADPKNMLNREEMVSLLQETATYDSLNFTAAEQAHYRLQSELGFSRYLWTEAIRRSGIFPTPQAVSAEEYFFGYGLVNALAAVKAVENSL